MRAYRSDYSNQAHQLAVSVSKHYYAGKDGLLKYQKAPFKVTLAKLDEAKKDHLVVYSLKDHASGVYYIETAFASSLFPVRDFLRRAWLPKADLVLHGLPDGIALPKTVMAAFPEVEPLVLDQGVSIIDTTSGFQSGAPIATKALESWLGFYIDKPVSLVPEAVRHVCKTNDACKGRTKTETKAEMWQRCAREIRLPSADF